MLEKQAGLWVSPYAMDLNLEKTTRQTTRQTTNFSSTGTIVYDATVPNFALDNTHTTRFATSILDNLAVANAAREDAIQLCREGTVPVITTGDVNSIGQTFPVDTIVLDSYDETTSLTDDLSQLLTNTPPTTIGTSGLIRQQQPFAVKLFLKQICLLPLLPLVMKKVQKPKACRERGLNSATTLKNTPCPSTNSSGAEETTSYKPKCFFSVIFYPTLFLWAGVLRAPN